LETI
jgi:hypothetical protein